jgi:hypothetical protein
MTMLEEQNFCKQALFKLCQHNGIELSPTGIYKQDVKGALEFDHDDDFRITWSKIDDLDQHQYNNICMKFEKGEISLYEKYQIEKYRFRKEHPRRTDNDEYEKDLYILWFGREYIPKFTELLKNDIHPMNRILEANGVCIWDEGFKIDPWVHIPAYIDIKKPSDDNNEFQDYMKFLRVEKNWGPNTFCKIFNGYFGGCVLKTNHKEYERHPKHKKDYPKIEINGDFESTLYKYLYYNVKFNRRQRVYTDYIFLE